MQQQQAPEPGVPYLDDDPYNNVYSLISLRPWDMGLEDKPAPAPSMYYCTENAAKYRKHR
jgi:hypothetical protein